MVLFIIIVILVMSLLRPMYYDPWFYPGFGIFRRPHRPMGFHSMPRGRGMGGMHHGPRPMRGGPGGHHRF